MAKICFLQPGYAHYRDQLFRLIARRHDVIFVYERSKNTYPGDGMPSGIDYAFADQHGVPGWIGITYFLFRENPDIVITSISTSLRTVIAYLYATLFRKRMILWIIEWRPRSSGNGFKKALIYLQRGFSKYIIRRSDALVVGGSASRNYALAQGKGPNEIFTAFQSVRDLGGQEGGIRKNSKGRRVTFLYLGRIIRRKGLDLLLQAFHELEQVRDDVFLLVGGDGPFKKYCLNLRQSLELGNVEFLGSVSPQELAKVYRRADVFVLPSYSYRGEYEAWGLVVNEAMSMGLAVITTTAVGAAYDMVYDNRNGFVVQEKDVGQLYEAMKRILDLDLEEMSKCSRQIFEEKNDHVKMADAFSRAITYVGN
jgi:glycosyltransferase involved in cell wall biosynthesis